MRLEHKYIQIIHTLSCHLKEKSFPFIKIFVSLYSRNTRRNDLMQTRRDIAYFNVSWCFIVNTLETKFRRSMLFGSRILYHDS